MAATEFGVNHPLAVKKWSSDLLKEMLKETWILRFISKDKNNVIYWKDDLAQSQGGDRIRMGLRVQLTGDGVQGDDTAEGNEESLTTYYDDIVINQLRHSVRVGGKMTEQRVPYDLRAESRDALADWWSARLDTWFFNQLCGNTGQADTKYTGNNATIAPTSSRIVYAGSQSSEASLASTNTFTLDLIDKAVEKAKVGVNDTDSGAYPIRPIKIGGENHYVLFLHPYQVTDLRTNTNTGQWLDIQKAAMSGGNVSKNPIFTGALGMYNNVIIHEAQRIPAVTANTKRAVLCGAQAVTMGFGRSNSPGRMTWVEELFDYKNQFGVSAGCIAGMKKAQYNSIDFSTIVISTYAVAH